LSGIGIETNPPTVTLSEPTAGSTITSGQPFTIEFSGNDDDAVAGITLSYSTDGGATFPGVIAVVEGKNTSFDWNVPDGLVAVAPQAMIRAIAVDRSGNNSTPATSGL